MFSGAEDCVNAAAAIMISEINALLIEKAREGKVVGT
jgi:hypothetical protein